MSESIGLIEKYTALIKNISEEISIREKEIIEYNVILQKLKSEIETIKAKSKSNFSQTDALIKAYKIGRKIEAPAKYSSSLTWKQKILFGISQCPNKKGTVRQILEVLSAIDRTITDKYTTSFNQVTSLTSLMNKQGILNYEVNENRFVYSIA